MKWINILGLSLQFFSFWFAAPELLGAETMKRFENGLVKFISGVPSISLGLIGLIVGISLSIYGIKSGMASTDGTEQNPLTAMLTILGVSLVYMVYIIFFYKRLQRYIEHIFAKPVIDKLIANNHSRKIALIIGAVFFTVGFLCQLVVLVWS